MIKEHIIILLALFITIINLSGQSSFESGEIFTKIEGIIDNMPGSGDDDLIDPTAAEITDWESMLEDLWQGDIPTATTEAGLLNYELIEFADNDGEIYYVLQSMEINGNYWGTYVFNPNSCQTNLIIQAPHPKRDSNTGDEGIHVFETVGASIFMLAGTHRCNSPAFSTCSGTTGACGTSGQKFRSSDMAHTTSSIFQASHELIYDIIPDAYVIQLHGFKNDSSVPLFILSNTTTISPSVDKLSELGVELVSVDPTWTYDIAHLDSSLPLKGTTNTQGRYTNNVADPCLSYANFNAGRFFHIEQQFTIRSSMVGWDKVATAIDNLFNDMEVDNFVLDDGHYSAQNMLECDAQITNSANLTIKAGKSIELNPGFEISPGAVVLVEIEACGN